MANEQMVLKRLKEKVIEADWQLQYAIDNGTEEDVKESQYALDSAAAEFEEAESNYYTS